MLSVLVSGLEDVLSGRHILRTEESILREGCLAPVVIAGV